MKVKHTLLVFLTGLFLVFIGMTMKIMHQPSADMLIKIGYMIGGLGIILTLCRLVISTK